MKNTKKSLFLSLVSLLLCCSMLVGTTFAWFTDSVRSGNNRIVAGNLDVTLEYFNGQAWTAVDENTNVFEEGALWEPGHTEVVYLRIGNAGTLALDYKLGVNIAKEITSTNVAGEELKLSDHILMGAVEDVTEPFATREAARAALDAQAVSAISAGYAKEGTLYSANAMPEGGEQEKYVCLVVYMPEEVGNEANYKTGFAAPEITLGIDLLATQQTHEQDSFDDQYDYFAGSDLYATQTKTLEEGSQYLNFVLTQNGIKLATIRVPASAIADPAAPVTASAASIAPSQAALEDENTQAFAYDIHVSNLKEELTEDQLVTVTVYAPNALAGMKAYHNGQLIEDAVYNEVAGTITFKTASFSPFDFTTQEYEVSTLADLREKMKIKGAYIKLTDDLTIDLSAGSEDRSEDHTMTTSGGSKYYNAVNVVGEDVAIDLNGHNITVKCSNAYNGNQDVGALFFVGAKGSLNITNTGAVSTGFIKMASSIYAVWAPYADPSYVDIYDGAFIADSYAGDPIGTPVDSNGNYDPANGSMSNENSNRALIYAGFGGNMNVYGGYFLYNNTPNDTKDRNNGAFNAKDFYEESTPLLTIHEGVMLSNKEYRQNPANTSQPHGSYDNYSVKLAKYCMVTENVTHSVTIDGITYNTWNRVTEKRPVSLSVAGYKDVFSNGDSFDRGEAFTATLLLSDGTTCDVTDEVTFSGYDSSTVGVNVITATYTSEEGDSVSTTYIVRFIVPVNLTVEPKRSLYNVGDVKATDFKVTAYDSTGVATTLSDFDMSISGNINSAGHVNVTVTKDGLSATCTILMWNMAKLEGNKSHTLHYMVPVLFNVSGWSNNTLGNTYVNLAGKTQTIPGTEEVVSGIICANNIKWNSSSPTGYVYTRGNDGNLTVKNASRYTTLGVEYWLGYDTTVSAVGYYFDGDMSTIQFASPAYDISPDNIYYQYVGTNGFRTNYLTCDLYDFKPGTTHTVNWVAIFPDGIQTFAEWTVSLKSENNDDDSYEHDPNKADVNVIILAGQSNAAGSAPITDEIRDQYGNKQFSNVFINYINQEAVGNTVTTYFTNGNNFDMYKLGIGGFGENYFGPELGLADYLSTNAPGESWYIIKYAPSGSELDRQWYGEAKLADRMIGYVQDKINILAKDYNVKLAGFVWMQGESDAAGLAAGVAGRYSANEQKLVKLVRDEFAAYATRNTTALGTPGSGIVFVNGGIATSGFWPEHATVNNAKKANCVWHFDPVAGGFTSPGGNIANSLFVDTSTLISKNQSYVAGLDDYGNTQDNSDQAHYSDESMVKLGTWFGNGLWSMMINCP